jgi:hypothetical protein
MSTEKNLVCDVASSGKYLPICRMDLLFPSSQTEMIRHLNLGTALVKFTPLLKVESKRSHSDLQSILFITHRTLTKAVNKYAPIIVVHNFHYIIYGREI